MSDLLLTRRLSAEAARPRASTRRLDLTRAGAL